MWSLRHAQTRAEPHLARIDCPALVINAEQDTGVYPSDAQRIYDALGQRRQDAVLDRHRPLLHHPGRAQREGRYHRQVDREAVALRVLAHFVPGDKVAGIPCTRSGLARHPLLRRGRRRDVLSRAARRRGDLARAAADVRRTTSSKAPRLRLVHKLGAGRQHHRRRRPRRGCGIAVANMPGANAPSVAEGAVLLMLAALRRLPELDRATRARQRAGRRIPSLGETVRDIGGCTVGLVGYGNIAKRVERIVRAMGADGPAHQHPRRRPPRLADAARPAGRQRHRLAAPTADRRRPRACSTATRWR